MFTVHFLEISIAFLLKLHSLNVIKKKKRNGELNQESGDPALIQNFSSGNAVKADDSLLAVRLQLNTEIKQMSQKRSVVLMNAEEED